jgi:hypothetical protein
MRRSEWFAAVVLSIGFSFATVQAGEAAVDAFGTVTAVSLERGVLEVDGTPYRIQPGGVRVTAGKQLFDPSILAQGMQVGLATGQDDGQQVVTHIRLLGAAERLQPTD